MILYPQYFYFRFSVKRQNSDAKLNVCSFVQFFPSKNPWDLINQLPGGFAAGLPNSGKSPGTLGLPHPSRCEYGPEHGGEPIPDWLNPSFDIFEGIDQK